MSIADTLRGLWRRWYIVLPGLIVAIAVALGSFVMIKPGYERTATQLLLPGPGTIPAGASNPYLFLGSLSQPANLIVRAMSSEEVQDQVAKKYPGATVEVALDPLVAGPVVLFTVDAKSDADAAGAINLVLNASAQTLQRLQAEQGVRQADQIKSSVLTKDDKSTLRQKTRLTISGGVGAVLLIVTLIVASLVDGLSRRRRMGARTGATSEEPSPDPEDADTTGENATASPVPSTSETVARDEIVFAGVGSSKPSATDSVE